MAFKMKGSALYGSPIKKHGCKNIVIAVNHQADVIKSFFGEDLTELSEMANKLNNGLNKNEVQLVSKGIENEGFFEKFFQLFS